jgi:hypothetical protein
MGRGAAPGHCYDGSYFNSIPTTGSDALDRQRQLVRIDARFRIPLRSNHLPDHVTKPLERCPFAFEEGRHPFSPRSRIISPSSNLKQQIRFIGLMSCHCSFLRYGLAQLNGNNVTFVDRNAMLPPFDAPARQSVASQPDILPGENHCLSRKTF